jgi:hypothetical protein
MDIQTDMQTLAHTHADGSSKWTVQTYMHSHAHRDDTHTADTRGWLAGTPHTYVHIETHSVVRSGACARACGEGGRCRALRLVWARAQSGSRTSRRGRRTSSWRSATASWTACAPSLSAVRHCPLSPTLHTHTHTHTNKQTNTHTQTRRIHTAHTPCAAHRAAHSMLLRRPRPSHCGARQGQGVAQVLQV